MTDTKTTALADAVTRCLRAETDLEAHTAWSALDGALRTSPEERDATLFELSADIEHPILLEYLAARAHRRGDHELVVKLTRRALKARPGRQSLLLGLQVALLHLGHDAEAAAIAEKLKAAPRKLPSNEGESVQAGIDTMHRLVNDAYAMFAGGSSIADLVATLKRAAEIERGLLAYWLGQSTTGTELAEGRGELTASAMYIAALRQAGEFVTAAMWFRQITEDRELLSQCLRDYRKSGEDTLNNGIGALIDTRDPDDLEYGGEILDFIDERPPFVTAMLPLACSCLATQRSELDRALAYLETAVVLGKGQRQISDGGTDIRQMAWADEDMAPLFGLAEFVRIVGPRRR